MVKRFFALILALLSLSFVATAALVPEPEFVSLLVLDYSTCEHPDSYYTGIIWIPVEQTNYYYDCPGSVIYFECLQCSICGCIKDTGKKDFSQRLTHIYNDNISSGQICTRCGFNKANGVMP